MKKMLKIKKSTLFENVHVLKIQKPIFAKNESPCGRLPPIGYLFRIYPKRNNLFFEGSQKWVYPKT